MRKRNIKKIADTIFWYVVYMLPIILTVIQSIGIFGNFTFADWETVFNTDDIGYYGFFQLLYHNLESFGIGVYSGGGIVAQSLSTIFGKVDGILPIFTETIFYYAEYFVGVVLIHLCVDFVLFIPRIAHKWMDTLTKEE